MPNDIQNFTNTLLQVGQTILGVQRLRAQVDQERAALQQRAKEHEDVMKLREKELKLREDIAVQKQQADANKAIDPSTMLNDIRALENMVAQEASNVDEINVGGVNMPVPPMLRGVTTQKLEEMFTPNQITDLKSSIQTLAMRSMPELRQFTDNDANLKKVADALKTRQLKAISENPQIQKMRAALLGPSPATQAGEASVSGGKGDAASALGAAPPPSAKIDMADAVNEMTRLSAVAESDADLASLAKQFAEASRGKNEEETFALMAPILTELTKRGKRAAFLNFLSGKQ